jgi:hypothetical protein
MRLWLAHRQKLTALASIALMLAGLVTSGHAVAAHLPGLSNAAQAQPCHHALNADMAAATEAAKALDQCREQCLSASPDMAAVTLVLVQHATTPFAIPASMPATSFTSNASRLPAPEPGGTNQRSRHLTTQRLLI